MPDIEIKEEKQEPDIPAGEKEETKAGAEQADTDNKEEKTGSGEAGTGETAQEEPSAAEPGKGTGPDAKEKKVFGRKKEKKDKRDEKIEELTDKLTRQMAEFDNYRKRTEKEKTANYIVGARDVIEKLLPIVDNFERGLSNADLSDPFAEGMDKVYKQLTTMLSDLGVTPIEALGEPFDPNLHNAVMHVEDETLGENVVAEEFQKGYKFHDQVVRHSMVKVAN